MAGNKRRKKSNFTLFPLFPRFQSGRLKSSADTSKLKNKEVLRDEGEPSCSQIRKKKKLWRIRIGKARKVLISPLLKTLRISSPGFGILSNTRPASKLSRFFCGCVPKRTDRKYPDSDPENFTLDNVRNLLENNDFYMNSNLQRIIQQKRSELNRQFIRTGF